MFLFFLITPKLYFVLYDFSGGIERREDGYIFMSKNKYNQCGIVTDWSYPSL